MNFVKTWPQIAASMKPSADFYDAETLTVFWETRPEIVSLLLPAPLLPTRRPLAMAFVANYPKTSFDVTYRESALFLGAQFDGQEGFYCLSMPVTNDMAMAAGREIFGYPKKMAEISLSRDGQRMTGWTERRGVRFLELRAELDGTTNEPDAMELFALLGARPGCTASSVSYNFKHFPSAAGGGFDYPPRLVRQETVRRRKTVELGRAEIVLTPSEYDPWAEVEVVRTLGAVYAVGDNSMLGGAVVAETEPMGFVPYAFLKWDLK